MVTAPFGRLGGELVGATSQPHRGLVGAVQGPGFTHLVRVAGFSAAVDVVGMEAVVRYGRDQLAVAVDVDFGRGRAATGEIGLVQALLPAPLGGERDLRRLVRP